MAFEPITEDTWRMYFAKRHPTNYIFPKDIDIPSMEEVIKLMPCRSTTKSAGYDFRIPFDIKNISPGETVIVPTGFKWNPSGAHTLINKVEADYQSGIRYVKKEAVHLEHCFLALYPRSSFGFKYGFRLLNTTGIIDADYYDNPDNEGHILVAFTVDTPIELHKGDKFCQGIIHAFGLTMNEVEPTATRQGGVGSTGA